MDQVEKANFAHLSVAYRLSDNVSNSNRQWQHEISDVWTCSFRSQYAVRFLTLGQIQNQLITVNQTHQGHPGQHQPMLCRL
jgi:hypothetical protein